MLYRRELPESARKEFTDAIACLQSIPTTLSDDLREIYPGVKTRYDEFLATHIQLTRFIHMTVRPGHYILTMFSTH
jgi:tyrosinase